MNGKKIIISLFFTLSLSLYLKAEDVLTWGADAQAGAPFIFFNQGEGTDDPVGFELDLMNAVASYLNKEQKWIQNDWENLIPGLQRGLYDIAMNGIGILPERSKEVTFTLPYYIATSSLIVRKSDKKIKTLQDCRNKRVGTVKSSTEIIQLVRHEKAINLLTYEDEVNLFADLVYGRIDAVVIDTPTSLYYAATRPELKVVDDAIGQIAYAIAVPKKAEHLVDELNQAISHLQRSGELRVILERWNLWNSLMAELLEDQAATVTLPEAYLDYHAAHPAHPSWRYRLSAYTQNLPILLKAAITTLLLSLMAMLIAVVVGCLLALVRVYGPGFFRFWVVLYIEIIRGTPLLIQLLLIFYGLPMIGIKLSPFIAGVLGLSLNYAAFEAENYRAGLLSVPRGQMEAARALGMSHIEALRCVVIPQAFRFVIPPMTNDFIALLKDSSLVSVITIVELTKTYTQLATTYYDFFGVGILVAIIYLLLGLPFVRLARWAEKHLAFEKTKR